MSRKRTTSCPALRRMNIKYARRKLAALLAANFRAGDLLVTLHFDQINAKSARPFMGRCMRWWVKERRRDYAKAGADFRYIYALDGGQAGGPLALAVVNEAGLPRSVYGWPYGRVTVELLDPAQGWDTVAWQLMRETLEGMEKPVPNERAFHASNGLRHEPG